MSEVGPLVSVVIPSRNAPASLTATLAGLAQQTMAADCYEVIVVGGVDEETIRQRVPPNCHMPCRCMSSGGQEHRGAAMPGPKSRGRNCWCFWTTTWNRSPSCWMPTYRAHAGSSGRRVVMGYLPPDADLRADLRAGRRRIDWLKVQLSDWWEEGFAAMAQPGHRFAYTDVLSGNFSLPAALFHEVGGFDLDYYPCRDDFEFGVRLLLAGAELAFSPEARSRHNDKTDLPRLLQRKRDEGRTDVQLARQYPHIRPALLISRQLARPELASVLLRRVAQDVAARRPTCWPAMAVPLLQMCEQLTMRATWPQGDGAGCLCMPTGRVCSGQRKDWDEVCCADDRTGAVAGHCGSGATASDCVGEALDRNPVQGVCLTWRGLPLGRIEPQAGAEPVARRHVEAWLRAGGALTVMRAQTLDRCWASKATLQPGGMCTRNGRRRRDGRAGTVPTVVWELDLAQGMDSLQPLTAKFGQAVLVRKAGA